MKKKLLIVLMGVILSLNVSFVFAYPLTADANKVTVEISANDEKSELQAYNIVGFNYFKLKDICKLLDWNVVWDNETSKFYVETDVPYDGNSIKGGNNLMIFVQDVDVKETEVFFNGVNFDIKGCNINGYNYFKLRDIGNVTMLSIKFPGNEGKPYCLVDWDNDNKMVIANETTVNPDVIIENWEVPYTTEEYAIRVVELINIEREKNGIESIATGKSLGGGALLYLGVFGFRSEDEGITRLDYDGYTLPIYSSTTEELNERELTNDPLIMVTEYWFTPEEVVESWMKSESEREAILNSKYKNIEVAYTGNRVYAKHAIELSEYAFDIN